MTNKNINILARGQKKVVRYDEFLRYFSYKIKAGKSQMATKLPHL